MDRIFSPIRRGGIVTPRKEKAHREHGLMGNELESNYSTLKPESLIQQRNKYQGYQRKITLDKALNLYLKTMMQQGASDDSHH